MHSQSHKMKFTFLFILILSLMFFTNKVISKGIERITALNSISISDSDSNVECNIVNHQYWNIIEQFYGSTKLISLYFIHSNDSNPSHFDLLQILLEQIPKSKFLHHPFSVETLIFIAICFSSSLNQGIYCSVTFQVIDTECGCVSLSYNRLRFLEILQSEFESGVLIVAENIYSIDKILFRLPQYVADIQRRKTIIAITNATDLEFDTLTVNILTKLFNLVTIANVLLITPCQNDPEVWAWFYEITKKH